jgi:hypothetical protein
MKKKISNEDAPVNSTGSAVPGTGSDVANWKSKKKHPKGCKCDDCACKMHKRYETIVKRVKKKLKGTYEIGRKPDPELVIKKEGKNMDWLHKLIKQGKSAEQISRIMELDRDTVEALMEKKSRTRKKWKDVITRANDPDGSIEIQGRMHKQNARGTEVVGYSLADGYFSIYDDMGHFLDWESHKELRLIVVEGRNYRKEYDNYHAQPEQRERNAARLRARRLMVKKGKAKKNDKLDVHHKDNNPLNNDTKNLSVVTQKYNRTEPRLRKEGSDVAAPEIPKPDSTFATMPVFKVSSDDFIKCQHGKQKHARWNKHIDTESDYGKKIHSYAKRNPNKAIIVQDNKSGHMVYLRKYSKIKGDK